MSRWKIRGAVSPFLHMPSLLCFFRHRDCVGSNVHVYSVSKWVLRQYRIRKQVLSWRWRQNVSPKHDITDYNSIFLTRRRIYSLSFLSLTHSFHRLISSVHTDISYKFDVLCWWRWVTLTPVNAAFDTCLCRLWHLSMPPLTPVYAACDTCLCWPLIPVNVAFDACLCCLWHLSMLPVTPVYAAFDTCLCRLWHLFVLPVTPVYAGLWQLSMLHVWTLPKYLSTPGTVYLQHSQP